MKKTKLAGVRGFKGFTQEQIAEELCICPSAYNKRENGHVSININQWQKLAEILDVPLEEIFENDDKQIFICKDSASQNNYGTNHYYTVPESLLDTQQKYITKLEEENATLKLLIEKK
jgi:transcriptional regulator with XRE-family HTH domain